MSFESVWRCDADGESYVVSVYEGEIPPGSDFVFAESPPCPICGGEMRRTVSLLDQRDWGAQFPVT